MGTREPRERGPVGWDGPTSRRVEEATLLVASC